MIIKLYATSLLLLLSSCTTYDTGFGTQSSSNVDMDDIRAYKSSFPPYPDAGRPSRIYSDGYSNTYSEADLLRLVGACHGYSQALRWQESSKKKKEVGSLATNIAIDFMERGGNELPSGNASDAEINAAFQEFFSSPPGSYYDNAMMKNVLDLRSHFKNIVDSPLNRWTVKPQTDREWSQLFSDPLYKIYANERDNIDASVDYEIEFCHSFLKKLRD